MPSPIFRYPLDLTGINPDNLIVGESKPLIGSNTRVVAPTYAPFYSDSVRLYNALTNQLLIKGAQYDCVELIQDLTLRTAKEVCQLILLKDPSVVSIRYDYQCVGGPNQFDPSALAGLWSQAIQDNRPVSWGNVLNKPFSFPPSLHNHLVSELYGFEPLVVELERIRQAIALSNVPAFETLIDWVKTYTKETVSEQEIIQSQPVEKYVTFERLMFALNHLNFNAVKMDPLSGNYTNRVNQTFQLEFTNPPNVPLFWTIDHVTTDDTDFLSTSGIINVQNDKASFIVSMSGSKVDENQETFRVSVRKNSTTGPVLKQTNLMSIMAYEAPRTLDYMSSCCLYSVEDVDAEAYYVLGSLS